MKAAVRQQIESRIRDIKTLPAMPAVLAPLIESLELPADKINVDRIVQLVSYDKSIAAQCLRMANSAMFSRRYGVQSIRDAILALGLWRVRDIALSCMLPPMFAGTASAVEASVFWRHSLGCALVSHRLARMAKSNTADKA